jgi:hypothetical protein
MRFADLWILYMRCLWCCAAMVHVVLALKDKYSRIDVRGNECAAGTNEGIDVAGCEGLELYYLVLRWLLGYACSRVAMY